MNERFLPRRGSRIREFRERLAKEFASRVRCLRSAFFWTRNVVLYLGCCGLTTFAIAIIFETSRSVAIALAIVGGVIGVFAYFYSEAKAQINNENFARRTDGLARPVGEVSFGIVDTKGCVKVRTNWYSTPGHAGMTMRIHLLPQTVQVWEGESMRRPT